MLISTVPNNPIVTGLTHIMKEGPYPLAPDIKNVYLNGNGLLTPDVVRNDGMRIKRIGIRKSQLILVGQIPLITGEDLLSSLPSITWR